MIGRMQAFYHAKSRFLPQGYEPMRKFQPWLWLVLLIAAVLFVISISDEPNAVWEPTIRNYAESRQLFWNELYVDGGETLYCGVSFTDRPDSRHINIEHVFPMSWVTRTLGCGSRRECQQSSQRFNHIEADMHNLYPSLASINSARGAMAFGIIPGEEHYLPGCDFEIDRAARLAEPRPEVRGNIARAMLYMADTYPELQLFPRQRALLEEWHQADPPDADERRRNRIIQALQGNTNPYIE